MCQASSRLVRSSSVDESFFGEAGEKSDGGETKTEG